MQPMQRPIFVWRALALLALAGASGTATAQSGGLLCEGRDILSRTPTPGATYDVLLVGDLAYVADADAGLLVLDMTDPAAPTSVGSCDTPGFARSLAIVGLYVFVADGESGLQIIDIADPSAPVIVASLATQEPALGVSVSGGTACVAIGAGGLVLADVSDPANPTSLSSFDTPGSATSVAVVDDIVYVADSSAGLLILGITDPSSPIALGSSDAASVWALVVSGGTAYTASSLGVATFDVSDPVNPQLLGSNRDLGVGGDITLADGRAYLHGARAVYDVSDLYNPAPIGTFSHVGHRSFIRGSLAFIAEHDSLLVLDVHDPPTTAVLSRSPAEDLMEGLAVQGSYAFVADWFGGMGVIDISDPSAPVRVASVPTTDYAHDLAVQGEYAYVADTGSGLAVIDISDPTQPLMVVEPTQFRGVRVAVEGAMAAVLGGSSLYFIDITDPLSPLLLHTHSATSGRRHGEVCIRGGFAYVAQRTFRVFDLSQPAAPPVAEIFDPPSPTTIDVQGDLACVGSGYEFTTFDISDPEDPILLGRMDLPVNGAESVQIIGELAFLGLYDGDLWVVDISDPSNPTPWLSAEGWLNTATIWDLEVHDDLVYLIDPFFGLSILDISDCPPCPGDFNHDGVTDSRDVIEFLNRWVSERTQDCSGGDCSTDLNGDGTVDTRDFVEFLNLWAAGC